MLLLLVAARMQALQLVEAALQPQFCYYLSSDDIKIYQIGHNIRDKFVVTSAAGMRFQASVLSLYVHALRVHFMSRRYFATRKIYLDLAKTETYQKHKDNFFLLDQGNLDIDVFKNKHKFENYIGTITIYIV